jgi:hypothetical protein
VPYDIGNLSNEYSETKALKSVHRYHVKENNHKAILIQEEDYEYIVSF